jgi:branched-chain amino acid transport system permease protein
MTDIITSVAPARSALDQDWRKVVRFGLLLALALVFISLAGMPVGLDTRVVIEPILSMGYLSLLWLPFLLGYAVSGEKVLEGVQSHAKGPRELVAGLLVGAVGGVGLSLLAVLIDNFDLRDPLVNWSPQLLDLVTFDNGVGYGTVWIPISGGIGLVGGALHVVPALVRRMFVTAVISVLAVSALEAILNDLSEGLKLEFVIDWLFFVRGGLTQSGALAVAVVSAAYVAVGRDRVRVAKESFQSLEGPTRTRANTVGVVVIGLLVAGLPLVLGRITNELLVNVGLFVLLALGLNIVVGLAGILDLGYVAFFAVGGYTAAVLTSPNSPGFSPELPWTVAVLVVVVLASITGLFIGAPVIRMRGDYLAIVTLGFGEIIRLLFLSDWLSGFTGGAQGITNIPGIDLGLVELKGTDPKSMFYLVLFFCALAVYASWRLEKSRIGRAWMAIREDESVAEAMGINTVNAKLLAFVVGAVLASFSGAIFAAKVGSIFPSSFIILVSIVILVVVIVGGMGNIVGVIAGAAVLIGILGGPRQPGLLQEFSEFKLLIYGALLVWMMLKRPEGLVPNVRRTRELHQEEFLQDAWLKGHIDTGEDHGDEGEEAPS